MQRFEYLNSLSTTKSETCLKNKRPSKIKFLKETYLHWIAARCIYMDPQSSSINNQTQIRDSINCAAFSPRINIYKPKSQFLRIINEKMITGDLKTYEDFNRNGYDVTINYKDLLIRTLKALKTAVILKSVKILTSKK